MAEAARVLDEGRAGFDHREGVFLERAQSGLRAHPVRAGLEQADGLDGLGPLLGQPPQQFGLAGAAPAYGLGEAGLAQGVELPAQKLGAGVVRGDEPVELPR
ncbi:hypothetical protein GCM10017674_59240 [Streptomyces gardneri]|uniref:Uncharacterized protein n=1 Tax=Streptomyces gardneri TaxID=66892 RepID=A0A4Y3RJ30_9ACTN|nr:hypothetical protein SGA01_29990 [Streptomyces gardneri]GHH12826.1 hypothetical protein GCM10017674_59240 [Streptomyces gardneri]